MACSEAVSITDIPEELKEQAKQYREILIEQVAEVDEQIAEKGTVIAPWVVRASHATLLTC
jgi:hypothetical protein